MHKALLVCKRLLFLPRCAGCGARMPALFEGKEPPALCAPCREKWEEALRQSCPDCFAPVSECTCLPPLLKKAGAAALVRAAYYSESAAHSVARHAVLAIKRFPDRTVTDFAARELREGVLAALKEAQYDEGDVRIAHLPRGKKNRLLYGLDQACDLAKALARHTGIAYAPLLYRVGRGKTQKSLTAAAREKNLRAAFAIRRKASLPACVILVDDVVTTGAGMAAATRLLRKGGVECVIAVSFAYTPRKRARKQ